MTKYSMASLPNGKKARAIPNGRGLMFWGVEVARALGYCDPEPIIRRECSNFKFKRIELDGIPTDCLFVSTEDVQRLMLLNGSMTEAEITDWKENYVRPVTQALDYEYRSLVDRLRAQGFIRDGRTYWVDEKKEESECPFKNQCPKSGNLKHEEVTITKKQRLRDRAQTRLNSGALDALKRIRNGVEALPSLLRRRHGVDHIPVMGVFYTGLWFGASVGALNALRVIRKVMKTTRDAHFSLKFYLLSHHKIAFHCARSD